jgi:predicted membrane channel-forming protein YqfA (hemolysin III family)
LLPLLLVLGATAADTAAQHRLATWLVLAAVPCAAAAAVVAVGDVLEGRPALVRALTTCGALVLLLLGSAVRQAAPVASALPAVAFSAVVAAAVLYLVPVVLWVLQPTALPRPRPAEA